ncbi:MAG: hypothetical protein AAB353_07440, partial [Candidatus Hydrogenedentota bacterium]
MNEEKTRGNGSPLKTLAILGLLITIGVGYYFGPLDSGPVEPEPSPDVRLDIMSCAGVIHVRFVTSDGDPVAVQGGDLWAGWGTTYLGAGQTEAFLLVPGGDTYT